MQAEIIAIGTELLLGEIADTNSAWIAQQLTSLGLNLYYTHTVGDNPRRIAEVMRTCLSRSEVVITTGGLGPTVDDWTREAAGQAFERSLVLHEDLLEEIAAFFLRRGRQMTENNRKQAMIPSGAQVIRNPVGTAPCFAIEQDGHLMVCLPGVPHEMKYLMEHAVFPLLNERYALHAVIKSRILHTCGIGESAVGNLISDLMELTNPTVGTAAHPGQTDVRITVKANDIESANQMIAPIEAELRARLGNWVYGTDAETLPGVVLSLLREQNLTLSTFDTACAGNLTAWLSRETLAPAVYRGGLSFADNHYTGASAPLAALASSGMSCQAEAEQAALLVRQLLGSDLGLAVTGMNEQSATDESPAYIALASEAGVHHITPRRGRAGTYGRGWLLHYAVDLVRRYLLRLPLE